MDEFEEPNILLQTKDLIFKDEVYEIVGICMEIHRILGRGFKEVVYKDALEYEFEARHLPYSREKEFKIEYQTAILKHSYNADFIYDDKIALEIKAQRGIIEDHLKQTINYLAASKLKLALIINFGEESLKFKRVLL